MFLDNPLLIESNIIITSRSTHFFYRQLDFQSEPGSCLAIFENGLETEPTLPAKTCLNDFS